MALDAFAELRGRPPKIERTPVTARVVKVDDDGIWVAPLGSDNRTPVGPCRGNSLVAEGDICLVVWTQERPWAIAAH